jgi:NADH-ubiquinone oxidoreductase chain 3
MSSMTIFILFVSVIALLFLFINLVFAPHNPYQEKDSMFECGFHSFQQSRSPFNIAFFIYGLVYLLLDLEILLTFPFAVSGYVNNIYGLIITLGFISIITIGFVFELGKGALNIPSKQHTYTIKNQPLIHISYIKTRGIIKPHPFITSPSLESSIFPLFIKSFIKYLTLKNLIIGLISLIVISLVKTLGIPMYILNFLNLENIEGLEVIILGLAGLVSRLGFKDLVEEIFIGNYATMGGEDPTQESSPDSKTGGVGATDISDGDISEKDGQSSSDGDISKKDGQSSSDGDISKKDGQSSSDGNRQPKSGSSAYIDAQTGAEPLSKVDTQKQESSSNNSSNYASLMQRKALDGLIGSLVEEVKSLNISMNSAKNDEE